MKATCNELSAAVIAEITGAEAVVAGAALTSTDGADAPIALCALTANLYVVPFVKATVAGPRINGLANLCSGNSTQAPPLIE